LATDGSPQAPRAASESSADDYKLVMKLAGFRLCRKGATRISSSLR
jgi:hypothetical protein